MPPRAIFSLSSQPYKDLVLNERMENYLTFARHSNPQQHTTKQLKDKVLSQGPKHASLAVLGILTQA